MDAPSVPDSNSSHSQYPIARTGTRSRTGCWTCKARRRKCDEKRPACITCTRMNLHCEGYDRRLVWGLGIASRGYLAGATKPIWEKITQKVRQGQKRKMRAILGLLPPPLQPCSDGSNMEIQDLGGTIEKVTPSRSSQGPIGETSRTKLDAILLLDFKEYGYLTLCPSPDPAENEFLLEIIPLADDSESLRAGFLAYQTTLNTKYTHRFDEYYADALRLFRKDLCDPVGMEKDATLAAGLLLCSIGMNRRLPWTMHIGGLYTLLLCQNKLESPPEFVQDIIQVIGYFDIPVFSVGRQTKPLNIWQRHCSSIPESPTSIEQDNGLPRSLLRLFSYIEEPGAETMFWTWPGEAGEFVQCQLWDAFRFAGVISAREIQAQRTYSSDHVLAPVGKQPLTVAPSIEVLTIRILAAIDAIRRTSRVSPKDKLLAYNNYMYPLFVAGSQVKPTNEKHIALVEEIFQEFYDEEGHGRIDPYYETPILVLREVWAGKGTADEVARRLGWEVGLT